MESICLKYRGYEKIVRRPGGWVSTSNSRPELPLLAAATRVASRLLPRACCCCQHRRCCCGAQRNHGHGALPPLGGGEVRSGPDVLGGLFLSHTTPSTRSADPVWVEETERSAAFKQSHIDKELALLSNSNMRDSVRVWPRVEAEHERLRQSIPPSLSCPQRTFIDQAAFLVERGDIAGAIRAWWAPPLPRLPPSTSRAHAPAPDLSRGRVCEYCSASKQLGEAHLALAELHAATGALPAVAFHAGRLESNAEVLNPACVRVRVRPSNPRLGVPLLRCLPPALPPHCRTSSRLKTCLGLADFLQGDMAGAARLLLAVPLPPPGAPSLSPLLHAEEVALYGALAAVASCSRDALRGLFFVQVRGRRGQREQSGPPQAHIAPPAPPLQGQGGGGTAKAHLDQAPALRGLVDDLVACRYAAALRGLAVLQAALASDPFASQQASHVASLVRRRCIADYLRPYAAVDLAAMAAVLGLT